mgnify:CR=1 FL=1
MESGTAEHDADLTELLTETRILLPGTEVFLAFLVTLPFNARFEELSYGQRVVYLCTFFSTLLALACFVLPATYHPIARPIHHKGRFKVLATAFLVAGLVPLSAAVVLVTSLVTSLVMPPIAAGASLAMAALLGGLWWFVPLARVHDRLSPRDSDELDRQETGGA